MVIHKKLIFFPAALFFIVIILAIFKIHGSSIGAYNLYFYGKDYKDPNLLAGSIREIRSDEWVVQTPLTISQQYSDLSYKNSLLWDGQVVSTYLDIPNNHFSAIFKPTNFSYFFLPLEHAFAFKWWFRGFLLISSVYFLLYKLYKRLLLAITGSLIFFFTPFVQWWYSVSVIECISFSLLGLVFFIQTLEYKKLSELVIHGFFLFYFTVCFLLILYPPFQISTGLFAIALALGYLFLKFRTLNESTHDLTIGVSTLNRTWFVVGKPTTSQSLFYRDRDKTKFPILIKTYLLVILCILTVITIYYISLKDVIEIISNTQYPGQREIVGGTFSPVQFFSGFYNIQLLDNTRRLPIITGNQSESASFLMLFPFLLPVVIFNIFKDWQVKKRVDYLTVAISCYLLLSLGWLFFRPSGLLSVFASLSINVTGPLSSIIWLIQGITDLFFKLLQLDRVPFNRMIIGIGVANLILQFHYLAQGKDTTLKLKIWWANILAGLGFLTCLYIGLTFKINFPYFLSSTFLMLSISFVVYMLILLLIYRLEKAFLILLLSFNIITAAAVNPLYKGLDPILNSKLSLSLKNLQKDPDAKVALYGIDFGNYFLAQGLKTFNATSLYPNFKIWGVLDPDKKDRSVYNRFAHIVMVEPKEESKKISLLSFDMIKLSINPCDQALSKLGVKYFLFLENVTYPCINQLEKIEYPNMSFYLYQRN